MPKNGYSGVLLTGPFMAREQLHSLEKAAVAYHNMIVLEFTPEADELIRRADRVIAMGGYNTICSILSFQKNAFVVPRVFPRREQWIRADRLKQLGLLDVLHPEQLSSESLRRWITSDLKKLPSTSDVIDLTGLKSVQELCRSLIRRKKGCARQRTL